MSVASKPKLRTYALFKETFITEKYVQVPITRRQRSLIAQLRLGILQLKIETGRYRRLAIQDRICDLCGQNIEDELHFVFACPLYNDLRNDFERDIVLIYPGFSLLPDILKLRYVMENHIFRFCRFIENCWCRRSDTLYKPN